MADPFDVVRAFGIDVMEAPRRLPDPAVWFEHEGYEFVLVSPGLSRGCREAAADEVLSAVLADLQIDRR